MKLQINRWLFASVCLAGVSSLLAQGPGGGPPGTATWISSLMR